MHEAYLRLRDQRRMDWQDRLHFFRIAARAMRRVLVDHCRSRAAQKRGGVLISVDLGEGLAVETPRMVDILATQSRGQSRDRVGTSHFFREERPRAEPDRPIP